MTVVGQQPAKQRLWRGYDDPGLPIGSWVAWIQATGDATGGDAFMQIIIEPEAQSVTGRYFNLEGLELFAETNTTTDAEITIIGFSELTDGAFANRRWTVNLESNSFGNAAMEIRELLPRPIFLGKKELGDSASVVQAVIDNTDGRVSILRAEGYIWDARSNQARGGARRPVDALYG